MNLLNEPTTKSDSEGKIFARLWSQVSLEVRGDNVFRNLQKRVLKWAFDPERNLKSIPQSAWDGKSFEIDAADSERAEAVAIDDPKYWAFRCSERLKDRNRVWITEVGLAERSETEVIFGCRVVCSQRSNSEPALRSIPRFVRGIAFTQDARLDGRRTSPDPWVVDRDNDVDEFISFLRSPRRKHRVVAFAVPEDSQNADETSIEIKSFIRRTVGCAHAAILTSRASYRLTEQLGREFSVFHQAIRTYNPDFDPERDHVSDHPLATALTVQEWERTRPGAFLGFLVGQTLQPTRPRDVLEREHPPFRKVKFVAAEQKRKAAKEVGRSDAELLALADEEIKAKTAEAEESLKLAEAAEAERDEAINELDQMKASYMALQDRVDNLRKQVSTGKGRNAEIPGSLDALEDWAKANLSGAVELHSRALRGAKKAEFEDIELVYNALLLLRDHYVPMRRKGGRELTESFRERCRELKIKEQQTFAGNLAGEEGDAYFVRIGRKRTMLDRHLKKGNSQEPRFCFRLYFFWDEITRQVIVGWLPSHLRTRAS